MEFKQHYQHANRDCWQGRTDTPANSAFFQIIEPLDLTTLNSTSIKPSAFSLLGFCSDEGVQRNRGRKGAADGPQALRQVLAGMPVHSNVFNLYDAGNVVCENGDLESAQIALGHAVALLLQHGITPIIIGGGHEVAYGHYLGITTALLKKRLDIINFDAHLDMRPLLKNNQGSSGTPFLQIAQAREAEQLAFHYHCIGLQKTGNTKNLFETANEYSVNTVLAQAIHENSHNYISDFLIPIINEADNIYFTFCLDVIASGFAPGVSSVQPYGLTPAQIMPAVRQIASSGKTISYDIAELSPPFDRDQCTAKLAAHLVFEITHNHSFKKEV